MNPTQPIKGISLFIAFLFLTTTAFSQNSSTAEPDTTDLYDRVIMDRVTVVGDPVWKNSIPGAASYIGSRELEKQNYSDINRVLRGVSGVNIQEEDGYGLRPNIGLRGAGMERSSKLNIMEDGVLIAPAPYSAPAAYYFPMVHRMSSVEVRKGSSQIKYGPNTTGGALNLISTSIPSELSGNAEFSLGDNSANKFYGNIGSTYQNFGFLIEGSQINTNGFKDLDGGGSTGFDIQDFIAKFMVRTNPDASIYQRVDFKLGYYNEVSDETYLGLSREDFDESPFRRYAASQNDQMNAEQIQMMARHFALISEDLDITTTLYRNEFTRDWYKLQTVNGISPAGVLRNPDQNQAAYDILRGAQSSDDALSLRSNNRDYFSQGIESIIAYSVETGSVENDIRVGLRLHQDEEDRFQFEDGYRMENGEMILTSAGVPGTQANRIGSATALAAYVQNDISVSDFTFTPGIRFENIWFENRDFGTSDIERTGSDVSLNEYTINVFVPGIGVAFEWTDEVTLISGLHKGFSPPSPGSSADTRSEESINYELGFRYETDAYRVESIGFFNNYSNLVGSDLAAGGGGGTTAQFNAGEVEVFGLELSAETNIALLFDKEYSIPFALNYTYTNATFQNSFDSSFSPWGSVQSGDKLPFIPEHQMNVSLGIDYNEYSLNLNANSTSSMRTTAGKGSIPEDSKTDSYIIVDASGSYTATETFEVFANLRNLFNNTYIVSDRPHGIRPGLPRTFMGGLKVNF